MKYKIMFTLAVLFLTACASTKPPSITADGDGVMVVMTSADYLRMKQSEADAKANTEFYKSEAKKYEHITDPTAQVSIRAMDALDPNRRAPTNGNDVLIVEAKEEAKTSIAKTEAVAGFGKALINGTVIGTGINAAKRLADTLLSRTTSSTTINADNGSTVTGTIGQGNTSTEQVSGILTQPAEVSPIALGANESGDTCELRSVLPSDPESIDANGDGLVCSDGEGGAFDN